MDHAEILRQLDAVWATLRRTDARRLASGREKLLNHLRAGDTAEFSGELHAFFARLKRAAARSLAPLAEKLTIEYPEQLPITGFVPQIAEALRSSNVVIVCGATGSGKTTQLPKIALDCGCGRTGRIGCTQPRRLAATALAQRLGRECGDTGSLVGCKIRFDDRTTDETVVKFMTDGILLAETRSDPDLLQYDCLILDEVHERSLNIDFLLGYLKLLLGRRSDVKVIIASATLESGRIAEFFGDAPVIEIPGTLHAVEEVYRPVAEDEELPEAVGKALGFLAELDPCGDTLVFLPGEREINDSLRYLQELELPRTELLPLFGRLGAAEQQRVFNASPSGRRRVILATNVAETSLTLPGIRFVIDSGLVRLSRYNPRTRIQELRVEFISQASARQRRGRCGRLSDGVCVRLYSEEQLQEAPPYTAPEIQRSALSGVILQMAELRLPPVETFPLVDPPSAALIREGRRTLDDLNALKNENELTPLGRELAHLPVDPHLGRMLVAAKEQEILPYMAVICAFLSIPDPRERPLEKSDAADHAHKNFASEVSDFMGVLRLHCAIVQMQREHNSNRALRLYAQKNFLNARRLREWRNLTMELLGFFNAEHSLDQINPADALKLYDKIHQVLLAGMPRQLACFDPETKLYMDMAGKKFSVFPGSGLARRRQMPQWLLFFTLVETSRVFSRCNAEVKPQWLLQAAPQLCKASYDNIHFDPRSGFVRAREKIHAGKLPIDPGHTVHYGAVNPQEARSVFIREGLLSGEIDIPGCKGLEQFNYDLNSLRDLAFRMRRPDSVVDPDACAEFFELILPPEVLSVPSLKQWALRRPADWIPSAAEIAGGDEELPQQRRDYPDHLQSGNSRFRLQYAFCPGEPGDGVTLMAPKHQLALLSPHVLDYSVPGYLALRIDHLLRALPKNFRRELLPIHECVAEIMADFRAGKIFTEQPLTGALRDELERSRELTLPPEVWQSVEFPEFLVMKLAVLGPDGKVLELRKDFPAQGSAGLRIAAGQPDSRKFAVTGSKVWPRLERFPDNIALRGPGGKTGYPALVDEGTSVGCALFLDPAAAEFSHLAGLIRLGRLTSETEIKYWRGKLRPDRNMELTLFLDSPQWRDQWLDWLLSTLLPGELTAIRSAGEFSAAWQCALDHIGEAIDRTTEILARTVTETDAVRTRLRALPETSFTADDADRELEYLLRPGFLRCCEVIEAYPRYLRSLRMRLERARNSGCDKDESKGEAITPWIDRFHLAAPEEITSHTGLRGYFALIEEARISAYTPDLAGGRRVSAAMLAESWQKLRLS